MFSLNDKERLENIREARYKAECGLADSIDVLAAITALPVKQKAEKVYCYCYLKGRNALSVSFYTVGDNAFLYSEELNKSELMEYNLAVISQLVYLKNQYEDCPELMPAELFMEFDPAGKNHTVLAGMESFSDDNEVNIRALLWFKEHGGKLKRSAELAMKMRFRSQADASRDPSANAVKLDLAALELSRKYIAGEAEEPAVLKPETGWDAMRAEMARVYKGDTVPMSFESDDAKSWVDVYDGKGCWHYLSCGLSAVGYVPEGDSLGAEYSLSLKKKSNQDDDDIQIFAVLNLMRCAIAKAQADKALLEDYAYIPAEQAGFIALPETKLNTVNGPSGSIAFKKLLYITASELKALEEGSIDAQSLYKKIGTDISDYGRKAII